MKQNQLEKRASFPGYHFKIVEVLCVCVQLQVIETEDGPPEEDEKNLLHVVYHRLACVGLKIKILNTELVDVDLKTTEALTQSFLKNEGNKKLFINPGRFRRIEK